MSEEDKYQLVVFGSARIDAFMRLPDDRVNSFCDLDDHECMIMLSYSAKIPMKSVEFLVGGNGANVAVGTKRLGINSLLVAELGQGVLADHAHSELSNEGIDMRSVTRSEGVAQGFGAVINYQGERTILSYYAPKQPPFPDKLPESEWAYLTSVGENFDGFYGQVLEWLDSKNTKLAFNPGGRQISMGPHWMKPYLARTDLLIVNRQEAEKIADLSGTYDKERELIDALREYGPEMVVVTDGTQGSYAFDGQRYLHCGVLPIDAIERTGAGDASSAAMLSALLQGEPMDKALLWATINSASVIGYVGPERGLIKKDDLPKWLDRATSSEVKVVEF